jgi:pyruvate/2-oxoglutarate dehydrogenase complex dihydrolipoamide acyltransferase (E2) component
MAQVIEMPKMSDTMVVGIVRKWLKNKGDTVSNGDILAEIETDKATIELEIFDEGVLLDVFVPEGSEAPIGCPLAVIGEEGEDVSSLKPSENFQREIKIAKKSESDFDGSVTDDDGCLKALFYVLFASTLIVFNIWYHLLRD